MNKTLKILTTAYYAFYSTTLLISIIGYLLTKDSETSIPAQSSTGIAISSTVIIIMMISIPLALAGFHKKLQKWKLIEDEITQLQQYTNGGIFRLSLIGTSLVISVIAFFFVRSDTSLIYCAGIAAIALIFCKPSARKIASDLNLEEE